jgi:hypothetical protein
METAERAAYVQIRECDDKNIKLRKLYSMTMFSAIWERP